MIIIIIIFTKIIKTEMTVRSAIFFFGIKMSFRPGLVLQFFGRSATENPSKARTEMTIQSQKLFLFFPEKASVFSFPSSPFHLSSSYFHSSRTKYQFIFSTQKSIISYSNHIYLYIFLEENKKKL